MTLKCVQVRENVTCEVCCSHVGQNSSKERQTVFFTAVNPMNKEHKDPQELGFTKPRLASYKQKWKKAPG